MVGPWQKGKAEDFLWHLYLLAKVSLLGTTKVHGWLHSKGKQKK